MTCEACKYIQDITDLTRPFVVRTCPQCKREMKLRTPGDAGKGIKIEKGDRFVLPKNWLQISANPLKAKGRLYRPGLSWFAEMVFSPSELTDSKNDIRGALQTLIDQLTPQWEKSDLVD